MAEQYPLLRLEPGFFWDQGDSIWSLASFVIPPVAAQAAVREAQARRDLAARRFSALQLHAISEVERAREVLLEALASVAAAQEISSEAQLQFKRVRRYFESGGGDRLELATARLTMVEASQHLLDAKIASLNAAARLEDAMQLPVLSDYLKLPDAPPAARATP